MVGLWWHAWDESGLSYGWVVVPTGTARSAAGQPVATLMQPRDVVLQESRQAVAKSWKISPVVPETPVMVPLGGDLARAHEAEDGPPLSPRREAVSPSCWLARMRSL